MRHQRLIGYAVGCTVMAVATISFRPMSVMFAVLGMSFTIAYLLHKDKP